MAILIALAIILVLVVSCCKVSGDADRQMENINRGFMEDYDDRK